MYVCINYIRINYYCCCCLFFVVVIFASLCLCDIDKHVFDCNLSLSLFNYSKRKRVGENERTAHFVCAFGK